MLERYTPSDFENAENARVEMELTITRLIDEVLAHLPQLELAIVQFAKKRLDVIRNARQGGDHLTEMTNYHESDNPINNLITRIEDGVGIEGMIKDNHPFHDEELKETIEFLEKLKADLTVWSTSQS
jgi:hypothetical protein